MTFLLLLSLAIVGAGTPEPAAGDVQGAQQQAPAETATAATQATPARERQICRRQARIGTLAGYESVCRTEAEWRAIAAGTQSSYRQLQGTHGSTHGREGGGSLCRPNGEGC